MNKTQLVVDAGGVVISNFPASFWLDMAAQAGVTAEVLQAFFHQELKLPLWTGQISEEAFWQMIKQRFPAVDIAEARISFKSGLRLLPVAEQLPALGKKFDLHLLSNHRPEWLLDVLEPVAACFRTITISSQVGVCKPNLGIYEAVQAKLPSGARIVYVDDQERNLIPARGLGWETVLADENGTWVEELGDY